jgi:hypothetical protein
VCLSICLGTALLAQNIENATLTSTDASQGVGAAVAFIARSGPSWVAWTVPIEGDSICCWNRRGASNDCCGRCTLDGGEGMSINRHEDKAGEPHATGEMLLMLRVSEGRVRRVRYFSTTCPVDGQGNSVHLLTNVSPESSIEYLRTEISTADDDGNVIAAISLHRNPKAIPLLIDLARHDPAHDVRRNAIFWLGQKAGVKAASELRRAVDEDPDDDVRQHAVFAISQLPAERAVPMLIELVKTHKSRDVRKRAMFWLAQSEDPRALQLIEEILVR